MTNHNDDKWTDVSSNETVTDSCGCVMCDLGVCDDTLTIWCDMTPEEKGSLLLAKHEGKEIEFWANSFDGWVNHCPTWSDHLSYRIKTQPKVETVKLRAGGDLKIWGTWTDLDDTHRITFNLIDGKPDPASIKMEEIQ